MPISQRSGDPLGYSTGLQGPPSFGLGEVLAALAGRAKQKPRSMALPTPPEPLPLCSKQDPPQLLDFWAAS